MRHNAIPKIVILLIMFTLMGCTDQLKPPPKDKQQEKSVPHNFLVYKTTQLNSSDKSVITNLKARSIDDLDIPINVASSEDGSIRIFRFGFQSGVFDPTEYSIDSYHTNDLLYVNSGAIFRLPVFQATTPTPIQLSSESGSYTICMADYRRANDYSNIHNSRLVYKKVASVADVENCQLNDGQWYMVKYTDTENDAPQTLSSGIQYVVDGVHDDQTGAVIGWLVVESGVLTQYDLEFSTPHFINFNSSALNVSNNAWIMTRTKDKRFVLNIDNKLYFYDPTDGSYAISNSLPLFQANSSERISSVNTSDGDKLFFSVDRQFDEEERATQSDLYFLNMTTGDVTQMMSVAGGITRIVLTDDELVYSYRVSEATIGVASINKSGGNFLQIKDVQQNIYYDVYGTGKHFYISKWSKTDEVWQQQSLERILEGESSGDIYSYHNLIGIIYGHKLFPAKKFLPINYFIVVQNDPQTGARNIHIIDKDTGSMSVMGALDSGVYLDGGIDFIEVLGHNHILMGVYHNGVRDLYYFDASVENSLKRLTLGTSENENGVYYKPGIIMMP